MSRRPRTSRARRPRVERQVLARRAESRPRRRRCPARARRRAGPPQSRARPIPCPTSRMLGAGQIDRLQRLETQLRRRVMAGAEAHGGLDHDRSRSEVRDSIRTRDSGFEFGIRRKRSVNAADRDRLQSSPAIGGPSLRPGTSRPFDAVTRSGACASSVALGRRRKKHSGGAVAALRRRSDGNRRSQRQDEIRVRRSGRSSAG